MKELTIFLYVLMRHYGREDALEMALEACRNHRYGARTTFEDPEIAAKAEAIAHVFIRATVAVLATELRRNLEALES